MLTFGSQDKFLRDEVIAELYEEAVLPVVTMYLERNEGCFVDLAALFSFKASLH